MISFKGLGNQGRLGNSMFQMAATIALALRNDDKYVFPRWEYENDFSLANCFSDNISSTETYTEPSFHYNAISYKPNLDLVGFFQSELYFNDFDNVITGLLTPKTGHNIKYDTTSIHVRRGDYLNLTKEYTQLGMQYYKAAMKQVPSKRYIIFSDDINWCRANFIGEQFEFSEGNTDINDLSLQIACENNIIANSSFSWWAAYLNKNPSKIVVAPSKWFGPALPHDTKNLTPEKWIKI